MSKNCTSLFTAAALAIAALVPLPARAEVEEVKVGVQPGLYNLPLLVIAADRLLEKRAAAEGLGEVKLKLVPLGSAGGLTDALLSGSVDAIGAAVSVLAVLWDKTRGTQDVKGIGALVSGTVFVNSSNPAVRTVADFSDKDRIAVSAVKLSVHAIVLQMAAEQAFGPGQHDRLDRLTVSMSHPDAVTALRSGRSEITAHATMMPFHYLETKDSQHIRQIASSRDILGGGGVASLVFAQNRFRSDNPKVFKAFYGALKDAVQVIHSDKGHAADVYLAAEKTSLSRDEILAMIDSPDLRFTAVPENISRFTDFLHRTKSIRQAPSSWKDLFFPEAHELAGF